jgi:hypothetical protein
MQSVAYYITSIHLCQLDKGQSFVPCWRLCYNDIDKGLVSVIGELVASWGWDDSPGFALSPSKGVMSTADSCVATKIAMILAR